MALNINNVLASAQKLMLDQGYWDKVDEAASAQAGKKVKSRESRICEDNKPVQRLEVDNSQQRRQNPPKFANAILESFEKMPPQSGDDILGGYAGEIPESFLNGLGNIGMPSRQTQSQEKEIPQMNYQSKKQQLTETAYQNYMQQPQAQPQIQTGAIDYNYIKYLIDESIKANMKGLLNESTSNMAGMKMLPGNKIQFMDSKGNVYEGVLSLKRKAGTK